MAYENEPIRETGIIHCCMCTKDIQKPVYKIFNHPFGDDIINVTKYWCANCGRILSNRDLDTLAAKIRGECEDMSYET